MKSGLLLLAISCENVLEPTTDLGGWGSNPSGRIILEHRSSRLWAGNSGLTAQKNLP